MAEGIEGGGTRLSYDREDSGEGIVEVGVVRGVARVVMAGVVEEVAVKASSVVYAEGGVDVTEAFAIGGGRVVSELADRQENVI